jgi:hypothetical protein
VARLGRGLSIVATLFAVGCAGGSDDSSRHVRTLIAYTKIADPKPAVIWTARPDGTGQRRLVRGLGPAVSPDGRWIAFHRCGHVHCDLWVIPAPGGAPRLLARRADRPVWSSTSDRIVAARTQEVGDTALLSLDPHTGRELELARGFVTAWSVSPVGDEVVYARDATVNLDGPAWDDANLYVVGIDGGEPRQLTRDGHSGYPVWGPEAIAFARLIPYRGWGRHEIWRIEPDGTGRRTVTGRLPKRLLGSGITGLVPVAWSEDGDSLLAELTNEFGGPPYAVDPETGAIRQLGDFGYYATPAGLSRDGRFVLVVEGGLPETGVRLGLVMVPYEGGRAKLIATRVGSATWNR